MARALPVDEDGLLHDSVRPSRHGLPAETVFLSGWQAHAIRRSDEYEASPLADILSAVASAPTQRDADVAASLMQWLGTNAGASMLHEASLMSDRGPAGARYLAAWAVANRRRGGMETRRRTLEFIMLRPEFPAKSGDRFPDGMPELTLRDYEVADAVAFWLGSRAGQAFLKERETEVEAVRKHQSHQWSHANAGTGPRVLDMHPDHVLDLLDILRAMREEGAARALEGAPGRRAA